MNKKQTRLGAKARKAALALLIAGSLVAGNLTGGISAVVEELPEVDFSCSCGEHDDKMLFEEAIDLFHDGVCEGAEEYTITFLDDVVYDGLHIDGDFTESIFVDDGVSLTIDTNGNNFDLLITGDANDIMSAFYVGGSLTVIGDVTATFNVDGMWNEAVGINTGFTSNVTIDGVLSVNAPDGEHVTGVVAFDGAVVEVGGIVVEGGHHAAGILASNAKVTVKGDVEVEGGDYTKGVKEASDSEMLSAEITPFDIDEDNFDTFITIEGDLIVDGNNSVFGIYANYGMYVVVEGNVKVQGSGFEAVGVRAEEYTEFLNENALVYVEVGGDVITEGDELVAGVAANGDVEIYIKGIIETDGKEMVFGVAAFGGACVTVDGVINSSGGYIIINVEDKGKDDNDEDTLREGYRQYSDAFDVPCHDTDNCEECDEGNFEECEDFITITTYVWVAIEAETPPACEHNICPTCDKCTKCADVSGGKCSGVHDGGNGGNDGQQGGDASGTQQTGESTQPGTAPPAPQDTPKPDTATVIFDSEGNMMFLFPGLFEDLAFVFLNDVAFRVMVTNNGDSWDLYLYSDLDYGLGDGYSYEFSVGMAFEGSTAVKIYADFISSLKGGTYTIKVMWADGTFATMDFEVEGSDIDPDPNDDDDDRNPATGVVLGFTSVFICGAVVLAAKRRR